MKKFTYKLVLSYDGTNYHGYQKQPKSITIQSVLENVLFRLTKRKIITYAASRTDKGVHAEGQVVHFYTSFLIDNYFFQKALNKVLPKDIKVAELSLVYDAFHARYHTKSKIYKYFFSKKELTPFNNRFQTYFESLDFTLIEKALSLIKGEHDFFLFTNNKDEKKSTVKIIYDAFLEETEYQYILVFHGKGFLKHMILFLVGFLIRIGQKKKTLLDLENMLNLTYGKQFSYLAPPCGLVLTKIFY
ncbi:tRNA pseudouridine(38-40) synthase TruA [Italian clover phyllody phytoplasma]|uniref:tRNA pseudouridine(38-40) synthase TruA n=1 Tax=Italian clover phyllody phytoplasma TaxID=1196420 RepID=UPI0003101C76|nr:tRNA pseudouridine(38-40) synthase TruA [Italian clover phyllody phytoplasma]